MTDVSPMSELIKGSLHQTCTVEPFSSQDGNNQPTYGTSRSVACAISIKYKRERDERGDYHTVAGTFLVLPGDDAVGDRDRISFPDDLDRTPIVAQVIPVHDEFGRITHKEVQL